MTLRNRDRVVRAAIELLGTEGVRSLTHRRVDARAGLPNGSTSNYFRTRAALLSGVVEGMVSVELPEVSRDPVPQTEQELSDRLVDLFEFFTGPNRVMTSARLALFVEAGHDAELRAILARGRAQFEGAARASFTAAGSSDPDLAAQLVAVCFEGLFLHNVGGYGRIDARAVIEATVRAAM